MDAIANYLTKIRNAMKAQHRIVELPASNVKKEITKILFEQGYILSYKFEETENKQGLIKIALKYNPTTKLPAIKKLDRVSTPGGRRYAGALSIPKVMNGLGIAIMSTSKGIMTDKQARRDNVGGEILCFVS